MKKSLIWLRNDLRLHDNPALNAAITHGTTMAIYIREPQKTPTEARDWWLHHSLISLEKSLNNIGIPLVFAQGHAADVLPTFVNEQNIEKVFWNRRYTPEGIEIDKQLKETLNATSFTGNLLIEPWEVKNKQGKHFQVFTPMFKELMKRDIPAPEALLPTQQEIFTVKSKHTCTLDDFKLINHSKTWHENFAHHWQVGEHAAQEKLSNFLNTRIRTYKQGRDFPTSESTSTLSPHLHFGEISAREVWTHVCVYEDAHDLINDEQTTCFKSELAWREFAHQQLYFYENLDTQAIKETFNNFPWQEENDTFKRWTTGQTGIPIVDAGMRELWYTGTMHNRVRMIVASFLTKNLLQPWQNGAKWFMDTLLDADEAANSASWQWVAGCGLDAAPYFRIFNPVTQGERFDENGDYVKKWVPELKDLDKKYIHQPWFSPAFDLQLANIHLGKTYPHPMVDLKKTRERALEAYQHIRA